VIVVDTNILLHLWVPGDNNAQAEAVLRKDDEWVAPLLWRSEFRNALAPHFRAKRLKKEVLHQAMESAERQMKDREHEVPSAPVIDLAFESGCTAHDCEFVCLANLLETRLVTSDRDLLKAFPDVAVSAEDFLK
jgi:predicted nucleic acid-binding protein